MALTPRTQQLHFLTVENTALKEVVIVLTARLDNLDGRMGRIEGCVVADDDDDADFVPGGGKRIRKKATLTVAEVAAKAAEDAAKEEEKIIKSEHRSITKSITYSARVRFEAMKNTLGYDKEKNTTLFNKEDRKKFNTHAMAMWDNFRKMGDGDDLWPGCMFWRANKMYPDIGETFDPAMPLNFFDYAFMKYDTENGPGSAERLMEACSQPMDD